MVGKKTRVIFKGGSDYEEKFNFFSSKTTFDDAVKTK